MQDSEFRKKERQKGKKRRKEYQSVLIEKERKKRKEKRSFSESAFHELKITQFQHILYEAVRFKVPSKGTGFPR